jgi:hypothetical protein
MYGRMRLTHHHRFSGCLDALPAWTRITCPDLSHSRITIAESMEDQSVPTESQSQSIDVSSF